MPTPAAVDEKPLLRFITAGHVDDGKSTLIGRLFWDSKALYEDQMEQVTQISQSKGQDAPDLAMLTDGLKAEREQGITIDVAYRYFDTPRRKFIVIDAPGHEQYTRNMVTGASNAQAAVLLVDARNGVRPQTRRHSYLCQLLGIRHLAVCINKLDLVDYSRQVYQNIVADYEALRGQLPFESVTYIPVSALQGDNLLENSTNTPWYTGPSLLSWLEQTPAYTQHPNAPTRLFVQQVLRVDTAEWPDFRAYAGRLASGSLRPGDRLQVWPSGQHVTVKRLSLGGRELARAEVGDALAVEVAEAVDISRGVLLAQADNPPRSSQQLVATLCWLQPQAGKLNHTYTLRHGSRETPCQLQQILGVVDITALAEQPANSAEIPMNTIARVQLLTGEELYTDPYPLVPATGSFILIDPANNQTVAAGLLLD